MEKPLRWRIGDVEVIRIAESCDPFPPEMLMKQATPDVVAKYMDWLAPHFIDAEGRFLISVHGLLIRSHGLNILVDTCLGPHVMPGMPVTNAFLESLAAAGVTPDDINIVLCTHLHFDHVGWNTRKEGDRWVPTFPKARYLFSHQEWEHWHNAKELGYASTLNECVTPIVEAGLADLVEMNHVLTPDVHLVPTPGHTPGHVGVEIISQGQKAFITGDIIFHPIQWAEIEWASEADTDAEAALAMRHHVRDAYGSKKSLIIGTHFAPPTAGHALKNEDGWRFEPAPQEKQ